jgi:hypothetical protein
LISVWIKKANVVSYRASKKYIVLQNRANQRA